MYKFASQDTLARKTKSFKTFMYFTGIMIDTIEKAINAKIPSELNTNHTEASDSSRSHLCRKCVFRHVQTPDVIIIY